MDPTSKSPVVIPPDPDNNLERDRATERCVDLFCEHIETHPTLPRVLKDFLKEYVRTHNGVWRRYDGVGVTCDGFSPVSENNTLLVDFNIFETDDDGKPIEGTGMASDETIPVPFPLPPAPSKTEPQP